MAKRGNENIKDHGFKSDRDKPLTETITVKVDEDTKKAVQSQDNPADFVREAIKKAL